MCGYCQGKNVSCIWPTGKVGKFGKGKTNHPKSERKQALRNLSKFCTRSENDFERRLRTAAIDNYATAISLLPVYRRKNVKNEGIKNVLCRSFSTALKKDVLVRSELDESCCNVDDVLSLFLNSQMLAPETRGSDGCLDVNFKDMEGINELEDELRWV